MSHGTENLTREIDSAPLSALVVVGSYHSRIVNNVLQSQGFQVSDADGPAAARDLCAHTRFDLAIYDEAVTGALDLAREGALSSKPRVSVGLVESGGQSQASGVRLHFILQKPFTMGFLSRTLRAAYGPIAADRRASFRYQLNVEAEANISQRGELRTLSNVKVVNLSQTGLCVQASEMLPQGALIETTFTWPRTGEKVQLAGTVVWAHSSGRAGVKFTMLGRAEQQRLENWNHSSTPLLLQE